MPIKKLIRLEAVFGEKKHETTIVCLEGASGQFDNKYDAHYMPAMDESYPQVFSKTGNQEYSINCLPDDAEHTAISLNLPESGMATLGLKEYQNFDQIELINEANGERVSLIDEAYHFQAETDNDFLLLFGNTSDITERESFLAEGVYQVNGQIRILIDEKIPYQGIWIYSAGGQCIFKTQNQAGLHKVTPSSPGIYLVRMISNNRSYSTKVIIP